MTRKPTQADLVIDRLRRRGDRGLHTFEMYGMCITNPSQRIADLETEGHVISSKRERFKPGSAFGARYTLVRDAGVAGGNDDRDALAHAGGPTDLADGPGTLPLSSGAGKLFDLADAHAPRPHYDEAA